MSVKGQDYDESFRAFAAVLRDPEVVALLGAALRRLTSYESKPPHCPTCRAIERVIEGALLGRELNCGRCGELGKAFRDQLPKDLLDALEADGIPF